MLSKDAILGRTDSGLAVFRHYIPGSWRVGRNFLNPLYEDRHASCNVYFDKRGGCYRLKDFGNDECSGDCFFYVGRLRGLDCRNAKEFVEILQTIDREMGLGLEVGSDGDRGAFVAPVPSPPKQPDTPKKVRPYTVEPKPFSVAELAFWGEYGISADTLRAYKVVSLSEFRSENGEGKPYTIHATDAEPMFGYQGKRYVKIYRPASEIRFLYGGNLGENYCFGLEQLPAKGDTLFITGGEKDVLSLAAHGFHAICFNSETSKIPPGIIKKLSYRFKHIILLYDTDRTGMDASARHAAALADLGVRRLVLPLAGTKREKDISDFFRMGGTRESFIRLFIDFLDNLYSETMAILKPCEIDFANPPAMSEAVISVNDVPLGTQGNLLGITGGEGTGKSNYVGSLIAGTIRDADTPIDTLGATVERNDAGRAVLLYDTEQSETQLYKNVGGILRRAGLTSMPPYLKAYCLTSISRRERMQAIVQSMDRFYYQFGGIQMVVIDGIADLVRCANDEGESISIIDELYRLAGIYRTCIVCVLHFIPNGLKLRGHLGSELQRKAAAILSIERDDDPQTSVIKALKVRDGSPLDVPLVQFAWNRERGMHTFVGEKPKEEKERRKETELTGVARTIFAQHHYRTYVELCENIQAAMDVSDRTAKSYIRFMREREIILKDPGNTNQFILGHI